MSSDLSPPGRSQHAENDWIVYRRQVLHELERLATELACIKHDCTKIREDLVALKVKISILSTVFGILGGMLPAIAAALWALLQ